MSASLETPQDRKGIRDKTKANEAAESEQKFHYFCVPHDANVSNHYRAQTKGYEKCEDMSNPMETIYRCPMDQYQAQSAKNVESAKRLMPQFGRAKQAQSGSITEGFQDSGDSISLDEAFAKRGND